MTALAGGNGPRPLVPFKGQRRQAHSAGPERDDRFLTLAQIAEMRGMWKRGDSTWTIARAFGTARTTVSYHCAHLARPNSLDVEFVERDVRAYDMRYALGLTYREIAKAMGYTSKAGAFYAIRRHEQRLFRQNAMAGKPEHG